MDLLNLSRELPKERRVTKLRSEKGTFDTERYISAFVKTQN